MKQKLSFVLFQLLFFCKQIDGMFFYWTLRGNYNNNRRKDFDSSSELAAKSICSWPYDLCHSLTGSQFLGQSVVLIFQDSSWRLSFGFSYRYLNNFVSIQLSTKISSYSKYLEWLLFPSVNLYWSCK